MSDAWGCYLLFRVGNCIRDEWLNVGAAMYDADGKLKFLRIDPARAVRLGFCTADELADQTKYLRESLPDTEAVKRRLGSTGHAMSSHQITALMGTRVTQVIFADIMSRMVKDP